VYNFPVDFPICYFAAKSKVQSTHSGRRRNGTLPAGATGHTIDAMTTAPDKLVRLEQAIQLAKDLLKAHGSNADIDVALETAVALLDSVREDLVEKDDKGR